MSEPTDPQLRDRLVAALKTAAHPCDGSDCRESDAECEAAHPVRRPEPWRYVVRIEGSPEGLADVALDVVQPLLDAKDTEIRELRDLHGVYEAARLGSLIGLDEEDAVAVRGLLAETETELHRYRSAWLSARQRAQAYGEGILRITEERNYAAAEVRGLEETAAERQQNAQHWQERARAAEALLDQASDEIDRLATDLAGYELHDGPPPRGATSTADISDYEEQPCP